MNKIDIVILCIFGFLTVFYLKHNYYNEVDYVLSSVDNRYYIVKSMDNKQDAADLLAKLNLKLITLVNHVRDMKSTKKVTDEDRQRLYANFNPDNISEGSYDTGYTSYSINKGEKIIMCLRSKNNPSELVKLNVLMYVAIHELSHLMTKEVGHPKIFWHNFKFLLKEAVKLKLYKKVQFSDNPVDYCGIKIKSSII